MSYMRFNFHSEILQKYVDISIVYPTDSYSFLAATKHDDMPPPLRRHLRPFVPGKKFKTIYLLHGGGDDDSLTYRYTNAAYFAQQSDAMLVTPNIANSFGADTEYGVHYQSFLGQELPSIIQSLFASSPARKDNCIMGYAMGGNVALATAIRYPLNYAKCVDISGGIGYTLRTETLITELNGDHFQHAFPLVNSTFGAGKDLAGSRHDIRKIAAENLDKGIQMPRFRLACGSNEFIRERIEDDAAALRELGLDVIYDCVEGFDHDFAFWNHYLKEAIHDAFQP